MDRTSQAKASDGLDFDARLHFSVSDDFTSEDRSTIKNKQHRP